MSLPPMPPHPEAARGRDPLATRLNFDAAASNYGTPSKAESRPGPLTATPRRGPGAGSARERDSVRERGAAEGPSTSGAGRDGGARGRGPPQAQAPPPPPRPQGPAAPGRADGPGAAPSAGGPQVYVNKWIGARVVALYCTLALLLVLDAFGTLAQMDHQRKDTARMVLVIVPGALHLVGLFTSLIVFINLCKDTVFLRLGLYDSLRREFGPFMLALAAATLLRGGVLGMRLRWALAGNGAFPRWEDELSGGFLALFLFERFAMLAFYVTAAEAVRRATSPRLYSRQCLAGRSEKDLPRHERLDLSF